MVTHPIVGGRVSMSITWRMIPSWTITNNHGPYPLYYYYVVVSMYLSTSRRTQVQLINGKLVHGYEVTDGKTYCTDCGSRLEVGTRETHEHTDSITHGRGLCPNVTDSIGVLRPLA